MYGKPRVGLVLMRASEFRCVEIESFQRVLQADEETVLARLGKVFDIVGPWVVDSAEALQACLTGLPAADPDLVLLAYQTWSPDSPLAALVEAVGDRPLVVWCYLPWTRLPQPAAYSDLQRTSGLVGTFAALGTLRNHGASFLFTFGAADDHHLIQDLLVAGRAASLRRALRTARFGVLPSLSTRMECTFVDEGRLAAELGPRVEHFSMHDYRQAARAVADTELAAYLATLRERYAVETVDADTLARAGRAGLGLARLAGEHELDLLAVNDDGPVLFQAFGLRPALYPDLDGSGGTLFQPEADLGAATANYILHELTGSPTMFLELYFWDEPKNQLVGGHSGMQNPALADPREVRVTPDYDCHYPLDGQDRELRSVKLPPPGAQLQFLARPGRVTIFQLRSTPAGWQAIALSGVCLEGQPWLEAFPHAILRLDTPMGHFLNEAADVGVTQHWVMAYGSVTNEIEAFCQMAGIPLEVLRY